MKITSDNLKFLAIKNYKFEIFSKEEFEEDFSRLKRVASKIEKYSRTGFFKTRLVVNNYVISCNCFGKDFVCESLFCLVEEEKHDLLKTFIDAVELWRNNKKIDISKVNEKNFFLRKILKDLSNENF